MALIVSDDHAAPADTCSIRCTYPRSRIPTCDRTSNQLIKARPIQLNYVLKTVRLSIMLMLVDDPETTDLEGPVSAAPAREFDDLPLPDVCDLRSE
jgi:hypothetical protein